MKVGLYLRTSTGRQEHGLKAQERACRGYVEGHGTLRGADIRPYTDELSGRNPKRPGLKALLHDAAMHRIGAVVAFRLDRLTRGGPADLLRVYNELKRHGVKVYSVEERHLDPDGDPLLLEFFLSGVAFAAALESRATGERVASGIALRRAEAEAGGEAWRWGRGRTDTSARIRDPAFAERARALRSEGRSLAQIARALGVGKTTVFKVLRAGGPFPIAEGDSGAGPRGVEPADAGASR